MSDVDDNEVAGTEDSAPAKTGTEVTDDDADSSKENEWQPTGNTTLDSLLAVTEWDRGDFQAKGTPWEPKHVLEIKAWGGLYSYDNRHVTIAPAGYRSQVSANRDVDITGDYTLESSGDLAVSIGDDGGSGRDKLTVEGNMDWSFHDKTTMMWGTINRVWHGGVQRYVGMEGVICGGAFAKTFAGGAGSISALVSGDVYGGCARFSGSRVYLAGLNYRSADVASWMMGLYIRNTVVTIEPLVGPDTSSTRPVSTSAARMAGKIAMSLCPFLEIGIGLLGIPVGIALFVAGLVRKKPAKPPPTQPRYRNRVAGVMTVFRTSDMNV